MVLKVDTAATLGQPEKVRYQGDAFPVGDYKKWVGKNVPMFGVSCPSSLDVFLQLNGEETNKVLDKLEDHIHNIPEDSRTGPPRNVTLKAQSSCLAVYEVDHSWYRARVIKELDPKTYKVSFVDYGDIKNVTIDKLMECPAILMDYVEGITPCALNGFEGNETGEELALLQSAICDKDLIGRVDSDFRDVNGKWRMLVTLFGDHNGLDFKEYLQRLKEKRDAEKKKATDRNEENKLERANVEQKMKKEDEIEKKMEEEEVSRQAREKFQPEMSKFLERRQPERVEAAVPVDVVDGHSSLTCVCGYLACGKLDFVKHNLSCTDIMPEACDRCHDRSLTKIGLALHYKIHLV